MQNFPKGKYLVTGGAGFIGSHLCEKQIALGCEVVAVDNLITGRLENIRTLMGNPRFQFIEQDINSEFKLPGGFAGVFHFASLASPIDYALRPIETLHVGAMGSDNMMKFALEKNCPVIVASTSEVYGDPLQHPQTEGYWGNVNPIGPRSCYDESKRYMEALTMAYHRVHGLKTRIVRIFNTYGPRMRVEDGRVVPNFCMQVLKGQDITIYGDGKQTRSFCYVDDLVDGILRIFAQDYVEPINLGNPDEYTILEFAERIRTISGTHGKLIFRPLPQDDPRTRRPDITKARTLLDWKPRVDLETGLRKTFEYFRTQLSLS